jgi:excisionase family DNA binding protein
MHTPTSAAKAVGVARSTIYRAIKAGRLAADRLHSGNYAIYPAELRRVFPSPPSFATRPQDLSTRGTANFPMWDVG